MTLSRRLSRGAAVAALLTTIVVSSASAAVVQKHVTPTWQTNGRVLAIAMVGDVAYIGGKFTSVRPAGDPAGTGEVARNHAAAIDLSTNTLLPWNPNANGNVQTIVHSGSTVYLGGAFTKVGGKGHHRLAAVDATSGAAIATWKPTANAQVATLTLADGVLYAGGQFTTLDGAAHTYLGALNAATGAIDSSFTASADNSVLASTMTADGSRLIIGGNFTHVSGASQSHIAALNATSGAALPWATHTSYSIIDLAADAGGVYVAGAGGGGNFAAFDPSTGKLNWQGGTDGNVQAITVLDGNVYIGGHYENYCGPQGGQHTCTTPTKRLKALAVDESSGVLQSWNPSVNSVLGIFSMAGSNGRLTIGGDFTKVAGTSQQGLAEFAE
jgi:outer membrane protein assembly factor BamB